MRRLLLVLFFMGLVAAPQLMPAAEKDLSVGADLGYVPNIFSDWHYSNAYQGGIEGRQQPLYTFGLRAKYDKKLWGLRFGINYLSFGETENTASNNAQAAPATTFSASGFLFPLSFCLNLLNQSESQFYIGYGLGYSSISVKGTAPNSVTIKASTSGFDWNFILGGEIKINDKLGLFMELLILRGAQNDASYSETNDPSNKIAVSRNMELFFVGVNYHFGAVF